MGMAMDATRGVLWDTLACICDDTYDCYGDCRDCRHADERFPACQNTGCENFRADGDILCSVCIFR